MTIFTSEVEYLFKDLTATNGANSQSRPVYKVDPFLDTYTALSSVKTQLDLDSYYKQITNVEITYRHISDANLRIVEAANLISAGKSARATAAAAASGTSGTTGTTGTTAAKTVSTIIGASTSSAGKSELDLVCDARFQNTANPNNNNPTTTSFLGNIDEYDIELTVTDSGTNTNINTAADEVVKEMKQRLEGLSELLTSRGGTNSSFTSSHESFNDYMYEINTSIGITFLKAVYKLLSQQAEIATTPASDEATNPEKRRMRLDGDKVRMTALTNLRMINIPWRLEPLIKQLRIACKRSLYYFLTVEREFDTIEFIKAFRNRAAMLPSATPTDQQIKTIAQYYKFRSQMNVYFNLTKDITTEDDPRVRLFMKKILVDMFIKTCYPLVHYDLINTLQQIYITKGNFINARMALISKCLFTYNMVDGLYNAVIRGPTNSTGSGQSRTLGDVYNNNFNIVFQNIPSNINAYIIANNKGNANLNDNTSIDQRAANIIQELQQLSTSVQNDSGQMQILQKAISDNQLTLRNTSLAIEQKKGSITGKHVEFYILLSLLIILIITCAVLYFLDIHNVAVMVAAGFLVLTLLFKLIQLIVSYVNKN